jgi:uncharacterized protein (UPF0216 family)
MGSGAAVIRGKPEVRAISALLGRPAEGSELVIYRPEVAVIRSRLPTTTQYAFTR